MLLYKITNEGELIELKKIEFHDNDVYVVDEENYIYIWIGRNAEENKRITAINIGRDLNNEKIGGSKLLIVDQDKEYGAFLAMMENLKKDTTTGYKMERREELVLDKPQNLLGQDVLTSKDFQSNIENWLKQLKTYRRTEEKVEKVKNEDETGLKTHIAVKAYFLSQKNLPYVDLCWILAEKELLIQKDVVSEEEIAKTAEEIFHSTSTYDELCWLIAELDVLVERNYFDIL